MVRIDATADDSLAAMRARSKFGIAIAAMIRMMATTINNSISENPLCSCPEWFIFSCPSILRRSVVPKARLPECPQSERHIVIQGKTCSDCEAVTQFEVKGEGHCL